VEQESPTWQRLEDQLAWYSRQSEHHQRSYRFLKVVELLVAAAIPVSAAAGASALAAGVLGGVVVVLEGAQQLFQFQQNWLGYRATAEALKREKFLYLAEAGPYAGTDRPLARLAERVEVLLAREHAAWAEAQIAARATEAERGAS